MAVLGVRVVRMLDYAEGDLDRVDFDHLVGRIVEPIRMHRPEVILSFGPDGITGDTDHVVLSRAVRRPISGPRSPWRTRTSSRRTRSRGAPRSSTTSSCHRERVVVARRRAPAEGYGSDGEPTLALELGDLAQLKLAAISRHVSQTGSAGPFHDWGRRPATRGWRPSTTASLPAPSPPGAEVVVFDGPA